MINSRRELIIMDFGRLGLALGSSDERLTKTGIVLGTPAYMSPPEQLSGNAKDLGPRCDIYSLGVIMYELLTACRPFSGQEAVILGQSFSIQPAPFGASARPRCPDRGDLPKGDGEKARGTLPDDG